MLRGKMRCENPNKGNILATYILLASYQPTVSKLFGLQEEFSISKIENTLEVKLLSYTHCRRYNACLQNIFFMFPYFNIYKE